MFMSRFFVGRDVRPLPRRRPVLEALEGRQLLSTFTATEVAPPSAHVAVVGSHIGSNVAMIQGAHIGNGVAMIQGGHIGNGVAMIQGEHLGTNALVAKPDIIILE
jgi:hypothetical protein